MAAAIRIELPDHDEGSFFVFLQPYLGVRFVTSMPSDTVVFERDGTRGLEGGGNILKIRADGEFTFDDGQHTGVTIDFPRRIANKLYAEFEGLAGQPLGRDIVIKLREDPLVGGPEDPPGHVDGDNVENDDDDPQDAGRKRRSRVKKQTRRTQRKRRNTVRK